jgi:hypothetical protein
MKVSRLLPNRHVEQKILEQDRSHCQVSRLPSPCKRVLFRHRQLFHLRDWNSYNWWLSSVIEKLALDLRLQSSRPRVRAQVVRTPVALAFVGSQAEAWARGGMIVLEIVMYRAVA